MKRTILSAIAVTGLVTGAYGQQIVLDNLSNSGAYGATSGGLVYYQGGAVFNGNLYNLGVNVLWGASQGSLSEYQSFTPSTDSKGYTGEGNGTFALGPAAAVTVPGVASGGTAWVELQMWDYDSPLSTGTFSSYAAAVAGNDWHADVIFSNPVSSTSPPLPASELVGMPSVTLVQVPEPATMALAGLGIASLLAFRRRS